MIATGPDRLRTRQTLLLRLIDWNNQASWTEFNEIYAGLIHNFVLKQGVQEDEARDVVQETLFSVAKAFRKGLFDPNQGSFKTWLLCVTRNRVRDHFRRRRHWPEARRGPRTDPNRTATVERVPDPRSLSPEAVWEEEWSNNVRALALENLKAKVKPKHFQIFHWRFIKRYPAGKVAKALGVSVSQVYLVTFRLKGKFQRRVRKLQRELEASPERSA